MQAFSSSIAGLLSSRAVLEGKYQLLLLCLPFPVSSSNEIRGEYLEALHLATIYCSLDYFLAIVTSVTTFESLLTVPSHHTLL